MHLNIQQNIHNSTFTNMKKSHLFQFVTLLVLLSSCLCITSLRAETVIETNSPGSLSTLLSETATEVTIKGPINGTDVKYLRHLINEMSLTSMDMTNTSFVGGGEAYFEDNVLDRDNVMSNYMFSNCVNLKTVRLSKSVTELWWAVFSNTGISEIDVPDNIKTMDWIDFGYCPNLTKVTLGKGLIRLMNDVFYNSPVADVYIKTLTPPEITEHTFTSHPTIHVYEELKERYDNSQWAEVGTIVGDLDDYYPEDKDPVIMQDILLKEIFVDGACTTLNATYQAMSDSELSSKLKDVGFDDDFISIVLKIKNNVWDTFEKDFRIQNYKPYSDAYYWNDKLRTIGGSYMGNPTGIYTQAGQKLYVFVDEDVPDDAKLSIMGCVGKQVLGFEASSGGQKLTKGLNVIEGEADALYYIVYTADTKPMTKKLSEWPEMKIHVEGGVVNGYYDASHHDDAEYQALLANASHERFIVKGRQSLFIFRTESFRKAWPTTINAAIQWQDDLSMWEMEVTGICETVASGSRSGAPYYLRGGESYFPHYYNNPNCAIEGDASDTGLANGGWFRESYNYYEAVSQSFDVTRSDFDDWCAPHEVGHTNQGAINLEGCTEVSNNMFSNIVRFHCGKFISAGLTVATEMDDYVSHKPYFKRDIWSMTRMYYQLYLYYHQAQKNTAFFPTLFQELRNDRLVLWQDADESMLKFVRKVCKVANEDLTDFFRAWGFFEPYTGAIEDYGTNTVTLRQEAIDATLLEISQYPRKNREILFIEDRITAIPPTGYIPSITERLPSGDGNNIGQCGDMGQFSDYVRGTAPSEALYAQNDNQFVFSCPGAVGILVLDKNEQLLFASNRSSFEMPASVLAQDFKCYCVASDGTLTLAELTSSGPVQIDVTTPGTLPTLFPSARLCPSLVLTGSLNGTDIKHLRTLIEKEGLGVIDMSKVKIVAGGDTYYENYSTSNDVLGDYMFQGLPLHKIALPISVNKIGEYAFDATTLNEVDIPDAVVRVGFVAFASSYTLNKVTIGKNVTQLDQGVFWNSNVEEVYAKPLTPSALGAYMFTSNPTIHVYQEALAAYQASDWAQYGTLVGDLEFYIPMAGIEHITTDQQGTCLYNIDGTTAKMEDKGLKIIRTKDGRTTKVLIR